MTTICKECGEWIDIDNKPCKCKLANQTKEEGYADSDIVQETGIHIEDEIKNE